MTFKSFAVTVSLMALTLAGTAAKADNATINDAISSRSDLSRFWQAFNDTGVVHELKPGASYTVFAPTNDAFAELKESKYPCLYSAKRYCSREVADIVRNHIVENEVNLMSGQNRGLHSIDKKFISIGEPSRNQYTVDGHSVTSTNQLLGSILYKIDGVIADPDELTSLKIINRTAANTVVTEKTVIEEKQRRYVSPVPEKTTVETTTTRTTVEE